MSREDSWTRDREYLGLRHPDAGKDGYEKWPRYCALIPPELAEEIDAAHRKSLGVNADAASRAGVVRAGLRMYLEATDPEREAAIEGTAVEVVDRPALTQSKEDR